MAAPNENPSPLPEGRLTLSEMIALGFSEEVAELLASGSPLVVSYGMGVDSTAMLLKLAEIGLRPDAVLFADTGSERAWTYQLIPVMQRWLLETWGLELIIVRTSKGTTSAAPYSTLYGNCSANETGADILFSPGRHGCSVEWKGKPLDHWTLATYADEIAQGQRIVKAIGFDASPADTKRTFSACAKAFARAEGGEASDADKAFVFWYPLQDMNITRPACEALIAERLGAEVADATGFACVRKSACVMCPSMTKAELVEMAEDAWGECLQALALELRAQQGKNGLDTLEGFGRSYSWASFLREQGLLPEDWKEQAIRAGYLPADWDQRAEMLDGIRAEFQAPFLARIADAEAELADAQEHLCDSACLRRILVPCNPP